MKNGPLGKVLKCKQCQLRVHAGEDSRRPSCQRLFTTGIGCCGAIVDPANVESWICELCENEESLESSVVSALFLSRDLILTHTIEPRLSTMSSSWARGQGKETLASIRYFFTSMQTYGRARLGPYIMLGVYPRDNFYGRLTSSSSRRPEYGASTSMDNCEYLNHT